MVQKIYETWIYNGKSNVNISKQKKFLKIFIALEL